MKMQSMYRVATQPQANELPPVATSGWRGEIELGITQARGRSNLSRVRHEGPLRVQRAFYPESDGTCHVYLLHPPGGVVQGDELHVALDVGPGSRCLVTTPGATKLYRSENRHCRLMTRIRVRASARCEWLPQECIVFNGARGIVQTWVELEHDASFIGWEITCLGRPAAHERFLAGDLTSHLEICRRGVPLLSERLRILGGSPLLAQPWGLCGNSVLGTLVVAVPESQWVDLVRTGVEDELGRDLAWSGTELEGITVFRAMGRSAETVKTALGKIWNCCRQIMGTDGNHWPRIWAA